MGLTAMNLPKEILIWFPIFTKRELVQQRMVFTHRYGNGNRARRRARSIYLAHGREPGVDRRLRRLLVYGF